MATRQEISGTPLILHNGGRPIAQCTRYLAQTQHFLLPVLSGIGVPGGPLSQSENCERRFALTVEQGLRGAIAIHSIDGGIFEEGTYTVDDENNLVILDSLRAFVDNIFIENSDEEPIIWVIDEDDLDKPQYLILGLTEEDPVGTDFPESSRQFGEFTGRVSDTPDIGTGEIILAVRPSGIGVEIDTNVPGRVTFKPLEEHIFDDSPHGGLWIQTAAVSSGVIVREDHTTDELTATVSGVFGGYDQTGPGEWQVNDDLITSGVEAQDFLTDGPVLVENTIEVRGGISTPEIVVESGMGSYGTTRLFESWEFNDQNQTRPEGVGIRRLPSDDLGFGTKSSDGEPFKVFDPSVHGQNLDNHTLDFNNPHRLIASGITPQSIGVLSIFGDTLQGDLEVDSGVAIDGIDFSELSPLLDGSNADDLHRHLLLQPFEFQFLAPEYPAVTFSGVEPGWLESKYNEDQDRTEYSWYALQDRATCLITLRPYMPIGYGEMDRVIVRNRVSSGTSVNQLGRDFQDAADWANVQSAVSIRLYDTSGELVKEAHHQRLTNYLPSATILSGTNALFNEGGATLGGTWEEGKPYRIELEMISEQGIGAHVSDILVAWKT